MKKTAIGLLTVLMVCLMTATAFAANPEKVQKERTKIEELSAKALQNLYAKVPSAERVIENCYAYATLSNTGMKLGIFGDAHGRGLAVNNETGERLYMRMKELGIGLGLGVKEYDLIFVMGTEEAWNAFVSGDIKFASSAEASASDGEAGGAIEGASIAAKGIWVYQMTKKGLALDASIKGTKIYADKKLNTYEEKAAS
ncbi:MAG: hypothetical protein IJU05_01815 [Schwartzia sp.]|nr:hypothetical protein [Schwartzia sp. (in: firmicutes)]